MLTSSTSARVANAKLSMSHSLMRTLEKQQSANGKAVEAAGQMETHIKRAQQHTSPNGAPGTKVRSKCGP